MALPDIKDKKAAIAISNNNNVASQKKFFDKLMLADFGKNNIAQGHDNVDRFLGKQDTGLEQRRMIKRIADNTDEMVLLLRAMKDNKKDNKEFNWKSLLPLLPLLSGLAFPEITKGLTTALKTLDYVSGALKATGKAADAAKAAAKAAEAAVNAGKTVKAVDNGLDAAKASAKAVDAVGTVGKAAKIGGKALGALGKVGDNKIVNNAIRWGSVGVIGSNLLEGDYVGAGLEGASLAAHEASRKAKSPKTKAILAGMSLATDGVILARDFLGGEAGVGTAIGAGALGVAGGAALYAKKKNAVKTPTVTNMASAKKITSIVPLQGASGIAKAAPIMPEGATTGKITRANAPKVVTNGFSLVGSNTGGAIGKSAAKGVAKLIPGAGLVMGAVGAADRVSKGDYVGAAGEAVAGLASLIPGIGTMASLAVTAGLAYRDSQKANSDQLKQSTETMKKATDANKSQIDANGEAIKKTTNAMAENAKGVKGSMGVLSKTLVGFTGLFGAGLIGWLADSKTIFTDIFSTLTSIGSKLGGFLKEKWNQFTGNDMGSTNGYEGKVDTKKLRSKLGSGDISGEKLGAVSSAFETGGRGVGTVSSGKGDNGGVSYGAHQMTAKTMSSFLNSKVGSPYKSQFQGLTPGTAAFTAKYKEVVSKDGKGFAAAQQKYIDQEYFGVAANDILKKTGLNVNKRGRALQELVYSTAVQYGPYSIGKWINSMYGKNAPTVSDAAIITAIQNYKIKNNDVLMKSSSSDVRKGVADRAKTEKEMLLNINAKNNGTGGNDNLTAANKVANPTAQNTQATAGTATRKVQDDAKKIVNNSKQPGIGVLKPGADPSAAKVVKQPGAGVLKPGAPAGSAKVASSSAGAKDTKKDNNAKGNAEWDLDKLVSVAVSKAKGRKAEGRCALFVREALQAAGLKGQVKGGLGNANEYPGNLSKIGWVSVGQNVTDWKKGDISVFMKTGSEKGQKYGHVAIWSGSVWVSDHIQKSIQPNASLGNYPYSIWRAKNGVTNGAAVTAEAVSDEFGKSDADSNLSGSAENNAEDKNPFEKAVDAVTSGIADLGAMFANSETVKNALDWVNSAKVDKPFQRKTDTADLNGFDMSFPSQGEYKYKFGEGGGFSEKDLYSQTDIRQQKGSDILGQAGAIPGIVRQQKGSDILGEAGKIPGIVRQEQGYDVLGQAGNLGGIVRQGDGKKKLKWWEKLFGGENSDIFKMLADTFGLGGVYDFGKTISEASKTGDWVGAVDKTIVPMLSPNTEEKEKVDGYIAALNKEKYNPTPVTASNTPGAESMPNVSLAKGGSKGNIDGMSSSIVTRNPDSIFREVSIAMMKASTT